MPLSANSILRSDRARRSRRGAASRAQDSLLDDFVNKHGEIAAMERERESLRGQEQFYQRNERLVNSHIVAGRQKRAALLGYLLLFLVEGWVGFELASLIAANNARHFQTEAREGNAAP